MPQKKPKNTPALPVDERGQIIDPFTGKPLIPVTELEMAVEQIPEGVSIEEADRVLQERIARGDMNIVSAAEYIGIKAPTLAIRLRKIHPEGVYLLNGLPAKGNAGEVTVKGSDLVFHHPQANKGVYIRKDCADGMKAIEEEFRALEESGDYYLQANTSNEKYDAKTLSMRSKSIKPDGNYLENGEKPEGKSGEKIVKGNTLRRVHPWNYRHVLLKKPMVDKWFQEEEPDRIVKERLARGDLRLAAAIKETGIDLGTMQRRLARIKPDKLYRPDGSPPTGEPEEELVLGSNLVFRHPIKEKGVYLRRELVEGIKQSAKNVGKIVSARLKRGDLTLPEAATATGISKSSLHRLLSSIKPDEYYLPDGSPSRGKESEKRTLGSELVYQSSESGMFYVSKALVASLKEKTTHGIKLADASKEVGIAEHAMRLRVAKIKPDENYLPDGSHSTGQLGEETRSGRDLVFRIAKGGDIYIRDELVASMKKTEQEFKSLKDSGDYYLQEEVYQDKPTADIIHRRAEKINKIDGDYLKDGTKPKGMPSEVTVKGKMLRRVHPWNSHYVLLNKTMVDGWMEELRIQKTMPAQKIGDADESKLPEDIRQILEEKSTPKRSK